MKKIICVLLSIILLLIVGSIEAKTKRSQRARRDFQKIIPCPSTGKTSGKCPGYVIDHVVPLKRGGSDNFNNMQWQTIKDAKEKDKWE